MATFFGRKFLVGFVLLISLILGELYVFTLHYQTKAIVFRAHYIALIELGLVVLSRIVWTNFRTVFAQSRHLNFQTDQSHDSVYMNGTTGNYRNFKNKCNNLNKISEVSLAKTVGDYFLQRRWHVGRWVLLSYLFLCHISYFTNILFIGREPYLIAMICYTALGSLFQLVIGICFVKLIEFCGKYILKKHVFTSSKLKIMLAVMYSLMASSYGLYNAASPPTVKTVIVSIKALPQSLEGFSIVQLTDIHLGPTVGRQKMQQIVDITNTLNADVVVLTGDLVDGSVARLKEAAEPLIEIKSKYGKYFISGNHEYYTGDVDKWFEYLQQLGFIILHNTNVKIPSHAPSEQQICLAGTDDLQAAKIKYGSHGMDLKKALETCKKNQPAILLVHQPKAAKQALNSQYRIDLVLSGHTHGGQMFPFMIAAYMINPFFAGLYKYNEDSQVYVSQGTQYWGVPMRIFTTKEITQLILTRKH